LWRFMEYSHVYSTFGGIMELSARIGVMDEDPVKGHDGVRRGAEAWALRRRNQNAVAARPPMLTGQSLAGLGRRERVEM